jgi:hypothetical protein
VGVESTPDDALPDDIAALKAALASERRARREAEAQASASQALVAHLKLLIAKLRREQYGQSSERGRKLIDQLELQFEELEAEAAESAIAAEPMPTGTVVGSFIRRRPVWAPLPAHLPRERVVIPAPCSCPAYGGKLAKLGEDITETLEVVPRQWKVIQKAWLFAGSDRGGERAAAMFTLIETAELNDVDPQAWLADVLRRINDHPASRLTELLPWNWRTAISSTDAAA